MGDEVPSEIKAGPQIGEHAFSGTNIAEPYNNKPNPVSVVQRCTTTSFGCTAIFIPEA